MQTCEQYQEQISRMIDGDLPEAEQAELRKHLEQCDACRELYAAFSAISAHLAEPELPPVDFSSAILSQIRQETAARPTVKLKRRSRPLRMAAMAAGFALILFAASSLPLRTAQDAGSESELADTGSAPSNAFDSFADDADGSDSLHYTASGTGTVPTQDGNAEESRMEADSAESESDPEAAPAFVLQEHLVSLQSAQPAEWIDVILTLCPLCDITAGDQTPHRIPDAVYSAKETTEPEYAPLSVWQTETGWIFLVRLDIGCFMLEGTSALLQQEAPDAIRWITETLF